MGHDHASGFYPMARAIPIARRSGRVCRVRPGRMMPTSCVSPANRSRPRTVSRPAPTSSMTWSAQRMWTAWSSGPAHCVIGSGCRSSRRSAAGTCRSPSSPSATPRSRAFRAWSWTIIRGCTTSSRTWSSTTTSPGSRSSAAPSPSRKPSSGTRHTWTCWPSTAFPSIPGSSRRATSGKAAVRPRLTNCWTGEGCSLRRWSLRATTWRSAQ